MLENLLNTKLKKQLLCIFFAFPSRSFSIMELRTVTQGKPLALRKTLREFFRQDVIHLAVRGHERFFRINPHFRLYGELKDLVSDFGLTPQDEVSRVVKHLPNLKLAILSGIFTLQPQLSVDLLLVGEGINRLRVDRMLKEIKKLTGQEINFAIMDEAEYEHRQTMNDRFIRDILDYPHLMVFNTLK